MSQRSGKRNSYGQSDGWLSDQDSRDRLRKSRATDAKSGSRAKSSRGASRPSLSFPNSSQDSSPRESSARLQGAAASQPELRLRAPKRQGVDTGSISDERRRVAARERAAGKPGSGLGREGQPSSRVPQKSISHKRMDSRAKLEESLAVSEKKDPPEKKAPQKKKRPAKRLSAEERAKRNRKTKEEREALRKQAQRKSRKRLQTLKFIAASILGIGMLSLLVWGGITFINSGFFYPSTIHVQGVRFLSANDIEGIAQIDPRSSTLTMDTSEIEDRLRAHPWIARTQVSSHPPSEVILEVSERTPAVKLKVEDEHWVASSDGRWLGYFDEEESHILDPTGSVGPANVRGISIIPVEGIIELEPEWGEITNDESLLNVLAHLRGLDARIVSRVQRVSAPEVGRTSLFTIDEVELDVGRADNLDEKSKIILSMLEEHAENIVLINVRSIHNPTMRRLPR